jgi:hypothetical protein
MHFHKCRCCTATMHHYFPVGQIREKDIAHSQQRSYRVKTATARQFMACSPVDAVFYFDYSVRPPKMTT